MSVKNYLLLFFLIEAQNLISYILLLDIRKFQEYMQFLKIHNACIRFTFLVNAYICYKNSFLVQTNYKMDHVKFQQSIIKGLIGNHRDGNARRGRKPSIADPLRESLHHHSLDIIPNGGRRQCAVCYSANQGDYKRSRINTWCATCGKGLCIGRCFCRFHNLNEE